MVLWVEPLCLAGGDMKFRILHAERRSAVPRSEGRRPQMRGKRGRDGLESQCAGSRAAACEAIGERPTAEVAALAPKLVGSMLTDPDWIVRLTAAAVLSVLPPEEIAEHQDALERARLDPVRGVVWRAEDALQKLQLVGLRWSAADSGCHA